ncbi:MAG: hypothetical protein RR063_11420, partial [Anaerovoracaceae bacterium]
MRILDKIEVVKPLKIAELRFLYGSTQVDFAKLLNIPTDTYIKKERGINRFFYDEVQKMSD